MGRSFYSVFVLCFWKRFPDCLKTLGVLAVAIKDRTTEGNFTNNDPTPALQMLADALANHPRWVRCQWVL